MPSVKISQLTAAASAIGSHEFEINDSGTSKKVTGSQIATYVESEISSDPSFTGQVSFADGTAALPSITNTGDTNTGMLFPAADTVALSTAGTQRVTVDASGNVGIGETAPLGKLHTKTGDSGVVTAGTSGDDLIVENSANAGVSILSPSTNAGSLIFGNEINNIAGFITYNHPSNFMQFATNSTEYMRIDASGNVGIGTTSPGSPLDVTGIVRIGNYALNSNLQFTRAEGTLASPTQITAAAILGTQTFYGLDNTSAYREVAQIRAVTDGAITSTSSPGYLAFRTTPSGAVASTEAMRIRSDGNVGIGTTSPITPLHVAGASITTGVSYKAQAAQTSKAAAATLTIAELLTGIIQYTGAVATLTLPTGTLIEGGLPATFPSGMSFDVSFINTGAALLTIGTATGLTLTGTMTVATGTSGILRFRKSSANNYNVYRVA